VEGNGEKFPLADGVSTGENSGREQKESDGQLGQAGDAHAKGL
jgi:hypothetical protein